MIDSLALPTTQHLRVVLGTDGVLNVTLDRPEVRNAMSLKTVSELEAVFDAIENRRDVRVAVLRGAGGHFCAGGDIKDMASARAAAVPEGGQDPLGVVNRAFGAMITKVDQSPVAVVAVLEGAVLGGGVGLACVADVAIAKDSAKFGLPETGLGIPPAQIAPFLVRRLGISQARRLAVTGGRFGGAEAARIGLVHEVADSDEALEAAVARITTQIRRCAPGAIASTKHLMLQVGTTPLGALLDEGAEMFSAAARGAEGIEGMTAFLQKRKAVWAEDSK